MPIELSTTEAKPGDTVTVLPISPFASTEHALITIEREDIIFSTVTELTPGNPLQLNITEEMIPNAFVSVVLAKGKGYGGQIQNDLIEYEQIEQEKLTAEAERERLLDRQGNIAKKLLEDGVTDREQLLEALNQGNDALQAEINAVNETIEAAEIRLGNLEETIREVIGEEDPIPKPDPDTPRPQIKMGLAPIRVVADQKRIVLDINPERQTYLPGESVNLEIVATTSEGEPIPEADLSIAVVDQSLLALKTRQNDDLFSVFFDVKNLGVRTASSLAYFINRINVASQNGNKGGGGGGDLELLERRRGDFRDTAFWQADAKTDSSGRAQVEFTLPDNTTTWQVWVTANTKDSRFGSEKANFVSRKPLIISPNLPSHLIVGDTATISASVFNQSNAELVVSFDLATENAEIITKDADNFRLKEDQQRDLFYRIEALGNADGDLSSLKPIVVNFSAEGDVRGAVDMVTMEIPVQPPAIGNSYATSGFLWPNENTVTEKFALPLNAIAELSSVTVGVSSSIAGNILQTTEAFIGQQSFSASGIINQQIATTALLKTLIDLQTENRLTEQEQQLLQTTESQVATNLQEIYTYQLSGGGFGFWPGSRNAYPALTAEALFAFEQAEMLDVAVDSAAVENAREYLYQQLQQSAANADEAYGFQRFGPDSKALAVYALSFGERFDEGLLSVIYQNRARMSAEGKAYLLLAMNNRLNARPSPMAITLLRELEAAAIQTDREAYFEASQNPFAFTAPVKTTSVALVAILESNLDSPLIPKIIRFLKTEKTATSPLNRAAWQTEQNTAWATAALLKFYAQTLPGDATVTARINLNEILRAEFSSVTNTAQTTIGFEEFEATENTLDIEKEGSAIDYELEVNSYLPVAGVREKSRGYGVIRNFYTLADRNRETPITTAAQGDLIVGKATILVPNDRFFTQVTIPTPAGSSPLNFALDTVDPSLKDELAQCRFRWCFNNQLWRFDHTEYKAEAVHLYAEYLPAGRYEFEFLMRADHAGQYSVLPAIAKQMFTPEVSGNSTANTFTITPPRQTADPTEEEVAE